MNRAKPGQVVVEEEIISSAPKSRVRDRIMKTASDLFYRYGIRAVGVDTIASEAGTNKMSFYRNFASKDELVAEYLRGEEREGLLWWDETVAAHAGNPRLQVESLFDVLVETNCEEDSRGCALANAAVEITEPDHPARPVIEKYKADMRRRFRRLAHEMGAREPDVLGDSLMLLWEGAYLTRVSMGADGPVQGAAKAARALIAAYTD
ncbi:MAG: TetR/AcrR family transcriptional regulator [Steroidobacteraceae bacterium]